MILKPLQIDNFIKNPDKNIKAILVYGTNDGLILDTAKRLARSICSDLTDAFQVSDILGEDIVGDFGRLCGDYNSQSLMGGRRVVMVRDVTDAITKDLRKMLAESKSDNLLILSSGTLNNSSSLVKFFKEGENIALISCYEDKNEDIYNVLKTLGLTFPPASIQLLYSRLSGDRMINMAELEKLKTYMGDSKEVTPEIITKVISDQSESGTDDICYAVFEGDRAKADSLYLKYLKEGNDAFSVARALSNHAFKLLTCIAGVESGETADKAIQRLVPKLIFYRVDSFKQQLKMWNKDKILRVTELLYETEKNCKTTGMPTEEIVGMTILQLSGAARK